MWSVSILLHGSLAEEAQSSMVISGSIIVLIMCATGENTWKQVVLYPLTHPTIPPPSPNRGFRGEVLKNIHKLWYAYQTVARFQILCEASRDVIEGL